MANNHSSVNYVEPNLYPLKQFASINENGKQIIAPWSIDDGYERAPRLEDYSIYFNLEVEICSRENISANKKITSDVLILSYRTKTDASASTVNFMGGTKIKCNDTNNTEVQYLTTNYADMYVGDLIDYGTTEMIGVKSVDIEYQNACVPVVTVKFTDVRGLSLFQPTELSRTNSYQGINGINSDNVAQSFFQCFFRVPMPKFTMTLKGFYGKPVTYECMCDKFDTNFNSKSGDFDITVRFIGYNYSFLTDVSIDALLAAPYSDYGGRNGNYNTYWDKEIKSGRFMLWNKEKTQQKPMPTLFEIWQEMQHLLIEPTDVETALTEEEKNHEEEIQELQEIKSIYQKWYTTLFNVCVERYGKDYCYLFKQQGDDGDFYRILILTQENKTESLGGEYEQFPDEFKLINKDLYTAIENYNANNGNFKKLKNVDLNFNTITPLYLFKNVIVGTNNQVVFRGFHEANKLSETQVVNNVFYGVNYYTENSSLQEIKDKENKHKKHVLETIYNNGVNQYIKCYSIEQDYSSISDRIKALQIDANKSTDEKIKEKKIKAINKKIFSKMSWYPTVENFTKIMMAHLETFMHLMYNVVTSCEGRTASELGVTTGQDGNCCDVNTKKTDKAKDVIPPFPRVTKNVLGDDNITKVEDTWVGEFNKGTRPFDEVDFIDGFFNAIEKLQALKKDTEQSLSEYKKEIVTESENFGGLIKHPLTSFDFFITKNPYGNGDEISNDINLFQFSGKVAIRMFNILCLNNLRLSNQNFFTSDSGITNIARVEAENFYENIRIVNDKFLSMLRNDVITPDSILDQISGKSNATNENTNAETIVCPWGEKPLFTSQNLWLNRYKVETEGYENYIYPIQDVSFEHLEEVHQNFSQGNITCDEGNISLFTLPQKDKQQPLLTNNGFGTVLITDNIDLAAKCLQDANNNCDSGYTDFYNALESAATFNASEYSSWFKVQGAPSVCKSIDSVKGKNISSFKVSGNNIEITSDGNATETYTSDDIDYLGSEAQGGNTENYTITEIFGYKATSSDKEKFKIKTDRDYASSFKATHDLMNKPLNYGNLIGNKVAAHLKAAALLSIRTNIEQFKKYYTSADKTFVYLPKLAVLQIGAACFATDSPFSEASYNQISTNLQINYDYIKNLCDIVVYLSKQTRYQYAKYFYDWCLSNNVGKNFFKELINNANYVKPSKETNRALLNQNSAFVQQMTNDLLKPMLVINLSVNHKLRNNAFTRIISLPRGKAVIYLQSFIDKLKELYHIDYKEDENGNLIKTTDEPHQTTDDMKAELYRYMKQLYDKWIPMSSLDDWNMENFFIGDGNSSAENMGHKFYFIDSYYNNIGNKLLINPKDLMERINALLENGDINAMMLGFMADIYGYNRCMLKCIQNFADLLKKDSMNEMFLPMSFDSINWKNGVNKNSSFVVVYPYEPSKNLNVANNEYIDDGFMLNNENETPKAIRTKTDDKNHYMLPAFGVSYGKQYQSYFKSVNFNMKSPIATQQSIKAKHFILQQNANVKTKGVVAQDLYDVYTTQSYTCDVEMMGCAWVQPLMYFVVLNVPMFRGSYLVMKVKHSIRPGDMTTTFTGCRMANVSNKLVEDIFTDDEYLANSEYNGDITNERELKADINNDCPYKIFPLWESDSTELTGDEKKDGVIIMNKLISLGYNEYSAAGIVGNMYVESYDYKNTKKRFKYDLVIKDSGTSGGLCMWHNGNLEDLVTKKTSNLGHNTKYIEYSEDVRKKYSEKLNSLPGGLDYQLQYLKNTMTRGGGNYTPYEINTFNSESLASKSPRTAAANFNRKYERSEDFSSTRGDAAEKFYKAYKSGDYSYSNESQPSNKNPNDKKDINQAFFEAVNKSAQATPSINVELVLGKVGNYYTITQKGGNTDKLGIVFDMILNSEYYNNIQKLYWVYQVNGLQSDPLHIDYIATESAKTESKVVRVAQSEAITTTETYEIPSDASEKLLRALAKHAKSMKVSDFKKEVPQVLDEKILENYKPKDCDSLFNTNDTVNYGTNATPSEISTSVTGNIDGWNVGNVVSWINNNSAPCPPNSKKCGNGNCATVVEDAIQKGGGPLSDRIYTSEVHKGSIYATNLHYDDILSKHNFVQIYSGTVNGSGNFNKSLLQAGDICVIGKNARVEGGRYHVCLWVGDKWVSDFKQPNMNVYKQDYPFFIYRFNNKKLS